MGRQYSAFIFMSQLQMRSLLLLSCLILGCSAAPAAAGKEFDLMKHRLDNTAGAAAAQYYRLKAGMPEVGSKQFEMLRLKEQEKKDAEEKVQKDALDAKDLLIQDQDDRDQWRKVNTPDGKTYYWNTNTNATTWEEPKSILNDSEREALHQKAAMFKLSAAHSDTASAKDTTNLAAKDEQEQAVDKALPINLHAKEPEKAEEEDPDDK